MISAIVGFGRRSWVRSGFVGVVVGPFGSSLVVVGVVGFGWRSWSDLTVVGVVVGPFSGRSAVVVAIVRSKDWAAVVGWS